MTNFLKALTLKFSSTYVGRLFRSMLTPQGLMSIAILSLIVSTAARLSSMPIVGEAVGLLASAILSGYSLAIMRQQTTTPVVALPAINLGNIKKMLADGTITLVLKQGLTIGLAAAGGMLGGMAGMIAGLIYGNLALAHYAASDETLPAATDKATQLTRGMKSLSSVADLRTIIEATYTKPLNTILALAASVGVTAGALMAMTSMPALGAIACVIALVTNAHVWSQVYRLASTTSSASQPTS